MQACGMDLVVAYPSIQMWHPSNGWISCVFGGSLHYSLGEFTKYCTAAACLCPLPTQEIN